MKGKRSDSAEHLEADVREQINYRAEGIQSGNDFLFWYWFTQELKRLLVRDQYLPALIYREPPKPKGARKVPPFELHGTWQWASESFEDLIAKASDRMPAACAAGLAGLADAQGLLRHCAEVLRDRIVRQIPLTATFTKKAREQPARGLPRTNPGG